jgi:hypothetical protein
MEIRKKKTWKVVAQWMIDVSKYLATGIVISSAFRDVSPWVTFLLGPILIVIILVLGILIFNKIEEEENS